MNAILTRFGRIYGHPGALSPIVVLVATLLASSAAYLIQAGAHAGFGDRILCVAAAWSAGFAKFLVLLLTQHLLRPYLRQRVRDGFLVCGIWLVYTVVGLNFQSMLSDWITGEPLYQTLTVGWMMTWWLEYLVLAGLLSQRTQHREIIADSGYQAATASARAADQQRAARQIEVWVGDSLRTLHTALDRLAASLPAAGDDPERWRAWSEKIMAFATGTVREVGHQAHKMRSRLALPPAESEIGDKPHASSVGLHELFRSFGRYHPVTLIPLIILLPQLIQVIFTTGVADQLSIWLLLGWLIAGNLVLFAITRTRVFRFASPPVQWVVTVAGICVIGIGIWPLGDLLNAPEELLFINELNRFDQTWMLTAGLLLLNLMVGFIAVYLANSRVMAAQCSSEQVLLSDEAELLLDRNVAVLDEVTSRVHSTIQGRLVAMALMANEAATGDRDPAQAGATIAHELAGLSADLPSLMNWTPPSASTTANITSGLLAEVTEAWRSVIQLHLQVDPLTDELRVPTDLAVSLGRVVAEGIANAVRHGWAHSCTITVTTLESSGPWLLAAQVVVQDDGLGAGSGTGSSPKRPGIGTRLLDQYTDGNWRLELNPSTAVLTAAVRTHSVPAVDSAEDEAPIPSWDPA